MQISFYQDWSEWFKRKGFNWKNFTFIELMIEYTLPKHLGCHELEIYAGLLGFNIWLEHTWGIDLGSSASSRAKREHP
jgi:hypothetical protein